jgi:hypothetical protein
MNAANNQNNLERLIDQLQRGLITADEANVQKVLNERVLVVTKLPIEVRKALNLAVKAGRLGHMKKDGAMPEVYFHPTFKYLANEERNKAVARTIRALKAVCR